MSLKAELIKGSEIKPEAWDSFVDESPEGMIYHKHEHISLLSPGWHAVVIRNGNQLLAAMPLEIKSKYGIKYSLQPVFAQYWGICFAPAESKISRSFELKKQYVTEIIKKIPSSISYFNYSFSSKFDYPLPFIWQGFKISPRYTYQINLERNLDEIWFHIAENARRDIRKAEKNGI